MLDELRAFIASNWSAFSQETCDPAQLAFTKFCQRVVQPHTKVLLLVTYKGSPLCILKIMRDAAYNAKLMNECRVQARIAAVGSVTTAKVLCEGMVGGRYVYAEEVISGAPVSMGEARRREKEIVDFVCAFPKEGICKTSELSTLLSEYIPPEHAGLQDALTFLKATNVDLACGMTHGDLGLPNILRAGNALKVIDWERAGELPLWGMDAAYFLSRIRQARSLARWRAHARKAFATYTGLSDEAADAVLVCVFIFDTLYHKYPHHYQRAVAACKAL